MRRVGILAMPAVLLLAADLLLATAFFLLATSLLPAAAHGIDLATIERKIDKLPQLTSAQPIYCLLVFGPEAMTRVWLVRDGDVLYVDRNGKRRFDGIKRAHCR
jgi:hypothetical protein